jgi:hypothetical protein
MNYGLVKEDTFDVRDLDQICALSVSTILILSLSSYLIKSFRTLHLEI